MTAPNVIWVEPSIAVAGTHGSTAWPDRDDDCISYIRADAPELLALVEAATDAREIAMKGCIVARVPECGEFASIAQDLDAALAAWKAIAPKPATDALKGDTHE